MIRPEGLLTTVPSTNRGYVTKHGLGKDVPFNPTGYADEDAAIIAGDGGTRKRIAGSRRNVSVIEPLGCVIPMRYSTTTEALLGTHTPVDLHTSWDFKGNQLFQLTHARQILGSVEAYEYMDGRAYKDTPAVPGDMPLPSPTPTYGGLISQAYTLPPNYTLILQQFAPPPGTEIPSYISIGIDCTLRRGVDWGTPGVLTLILPSLYVSEKKSKQKAAAEISDIYGPTLHAMTLEEYNLSPTVNFSWDGEVLARASDLDQKRVSAVSTSFYRFETFQDPSRFKGVHLVITMHSFTGESTKLNNLIERVRDALVAGNQWHVYFPFVEVADTTVYRISTAGARRIFRVDPILYGNIQGWGESPAECRFKPPISTLVTTPHNKDVEYDSVITEAPGWTTTVTRAHPNPSDDISPEIQFDQTFANLASAYRRPIVWHTGVESPTVLAQTNTAAVTSAGYGLEYLQYTLRQDWRGSEGMVKFSHNTTIPAVVEALFSQHAIEMGWDGAASPAAIRRAQVAVAYTRPDKPTQARRGGENMGHPTPDIALGDFAQTVLATTEMVDVMSPDGRTLGDWFRSIGNRLGMPDASISVAATLEDVIIPLALPNPHELRFKSQEGESYAQHLDMVCNALELRWGVDKDADGSMFLDHGAPDYIDGTSTISLSLDYDTLTMVNVPYDVEHNAVRDGFRNAFKTVYHPARSSDINYTNWAAAHSRSVYFLPALSDIQADGTIAWKRLQPKHGSFTPEGDAGKMVRDTQKQFRNLLVWRMPLRIDLRPDMFVQITDVPNIGATASGVYQLVQHQMTIDMGAETAESELHALEVHPASHITIT